MKDAGPAIVGVVVSCAALAGLVYWGSSRAKSQREQMAKDDPTVTPVGLFPALKVGDVLLVDTKLANLPAPFSALGRAVMFVDLVLQDPAVVSVASQAPSTPRVPGVPFFSGTIPKLAILNVGSPSDLEV